MNTLPFSPGTAVPIGQSCFSFATTEDGLIGYFKRPKHLESFDFHADNARGALFLRVAKRAAGGVWRVDRQAAFGLGRSTVQRTVNRFRQQGPASFRGVRPSRRASVLVTADRLLSQPLCEAGLRWQYEAESALRWSSR